MIGVGSVAEHKSGPAFSLAQGGELTGVSSRTYESATAYARRHNVGSVFPTPSLLIHSQTIDAVYIATPPASHVGLALEVAKAGKPCCIEKPMAPRYKDAQLALEAFEEAAVPLFVSYYRRSLPRFVKVAQWVSDGQIGKVREVRWHLDRRPALRGGANSWRVSKLEAPGGLFDDLACHGLDLFDFIVGPITSVDSARVESHNEGAPPHFVEATWRHGADVTGFGKWNFSADERRDDVVVVGSDGYITFSVFEEAPIVLHGFETAELVISNPAPVQLFHVEAMNGHLLGQMHHPSTAQSAIRTAWVTERIIHGTAPMAAGAIPAVASTP